MGTANHKSSERDEIAFLKAKAKDGSHWLLLSSTLLEEARLEMSNVCHGLLYLQSLRAEQI